MILLKPVTANPLSHALHMTIRRLTARLVPFARPSSWSCVPTAAGAKAGQVGDQREPPVYRSCMTEQRQQGSSRDSNQSEQDIALAHRLSNRSACCKATHSSRSLPGGSCTTTGHCRQHACFSTCGFTKQTLQSISQPGDCCLLTLAPED